MSIARHGHAVTIRWGPSARAARYVVAVALSDGRRRVFLLRSRRVNVSGVPVTSSVVVRVAGLDANNHHGGVATARRARLRSRRAAPVPRLHIYARRKSSNDGPVRLGSNDQWLRIVSGHAMRTQEAFAGLLLFLSRVAGPPS